MNTEVLKPFKLEDAETLISWVKNREELAQFAGPRFTFPLTKAQIEQYLQSEKRKVYKLVEIATGQTIGMGEIYNDSEEVAKLARILIGEPRARGKGLGTLLIQQLVQIATEEMGKKQVLLNVYTWNKPAIQCYKKVGFKLKKRNASFINVAGKQWEAVEMGYQKTNF